jgi:hypothetical protein
MRGGSARGSAFKAGLLIGQVVQRRQPHLALLGHTRQQPAAFQTDVIMGQTLVRQSGQGCGGQRMTGRLQGFTQGIGQGV